MFAPPSSSSKQLLPILSKGSSIVLVASLAARGVVGTIQAYAATKGAVETLVKHFASLLGGRGIRVNAVAPGVVETDMSSFTKTEAGRDLALGMQVFKRLAQPDDIGSVVAFLASEDARWVTGDIVHVDGGSKLRAGRGHHGAVDAYRKPGFAFLRRRSMNNQSNSQQSKTVVDAYYQAGVEGRLREFAPYLHPDFTTTAPNYLPWGGFHLGAAFFRDEVLPNLPDTLDFGRFSYDVFLAENDRVVALVNFGLMGSDAMIKISEHWTVKNGKATSIWVAYFEPQALLDSLGIVHGLKR